MRQRISKNPIEFVLYGHLLPAILCDLFKQQNHIGENSLNILVKDVGLCPLTLSELGSYQAQTYAGSVHDVMISVTSYVNHYCCVIRPCFLSFCLSLQLLQSFFFFFFRLCLLYLSFFSSARFSQTISQ